MRQGRIRPLGNEEVRAIFRKFGADEQERGSTMEIKSGVRLVDVSLLKPHPRNAEIYGKEDVSDLIAQIEAYGGIADPLKVKEDCTIISGHRRWQAAQELGLTEVPCQIVSYDSEEEELAALVMFNYHRVKTNEQKAREGMVLEQSLRAEGMERKIQALKQNQADRAPGSPTDVLEKVDGSSVGADSGEKKGRTRDIVADAVKISSGRNFERMKKVIVAADKLKERGKATDADFLLQTMERSVKPASNLLDAGYITLPDQERERIRNGEVSIRQFLSEHLDKSNSGTSFKRIMKNLTTAKQALSDVAQTIDTLAESETAELMQKLKSIQAALSAITTVLENSGNSLPE